MAEQKDNSVLFSLKELMNIEEERIKQEEDDKKRREDEMPVRLSSYERFIRPRSCSVSREAGRPNAILFSFLACTAPDRRSWSRFSPATRSWRAPKN